jgi:hypothetical protein
VHLFNLFDKKINNFEVISLMKKAIVIDVLTAPKFNFEEGLWEVEVVYKDSINNQEKTSLFVKTKADALKIRKGFTLPVKE